MINVLKVLWERGTSKYFKLKSNIKITLKIDHFNYPRRLLKPPCKYEKAAILIATHKKTAIAIAINIEKTFCSIVGGCILWLLYSKKLKRNDFNAKVINVKEINAVEELLLYFFHGINTVPTSGFQIM